MTKRTGRGKTKKKVIEIRQNRLTWRKIRDDHGKKTKKWEKVEVKK